MPLTTSSQAAHGTHESIKKTPAKDLISQSKKPISASPLTAPATASKKPKDTNSPTFRFLHLPAEVRNIIYRYALIYPTEYKHKSRHISKDAAPIEPGILRTCRRVRGEAKSMFYAQTWDHDSVNYNMDLAIKFVNKHKTGSSEKSNFAFNIILTYSDHPDVASIADNVVSEIKTWYNSKGGPALGPSQGPRGHSGNSRYSISFALHRLWDIARRLKMAGVPWELASSILDSATDLVDCGPSKIKFKQRVSDSCCRRYLKDI